MTSTRRADRGVSATALLALVFSCALVAHAALARERTTGSATMAGMTMSFGAPHSTMWIPAHGASWNSTAQAFVAMWSMMMIPMMLPSAVPALWRVRAGSVRCDAEGTRARALAYRPVVLAALAYCIVWIALGAALFPCGALVVELLAHVPTLARAAPSLTVATLVAGGAIQFTPWKGRRLHACRRAQRREASTASASDAVRYGTRLGVDCVASCANWTAMLLVGGMMDPATMLAVTGAITAERLVTEAPYVRHLTGGIALAIAIVVLVRQTPGA